MDNEMELYIITRQQSKRELVAAISLNDGGYDYYLISSDGEPKSNSNELMGSFLARNVQPRVKEIKNIVQFIGSDNVEKINIEDTKNINYLQNQYFHRRIASLVDQSLKEELEKDNKEKNREEYLKG